MSTDEFEHDIDIDIDDKEETSLEEQKIAEISAQQLEEEQEEDKMDDDIDEDEIDEIQDPVIEDADDESIEIELDDESDEEIIEPEKKEALLSTDIVSIYETYSEYYSSKKTTLPFLSKFEKAKVLGVRAQMLAGGSDPLIQPPLPDTCYKIAVEELKQKKIPLMIRRYLPDKTFEDWRLEDLAVRIY